MTTREDLDTAIRTYIADQAHDTPGVDGPVTHWTLVAATLAPDDDESPFWVEAPPGQADYITTGLLYVALNPGQEIS